MDEKLQSSKKSQRRKKKGDQLVLQDQLIGQFLKLTNIPIPIVDESKMSYYVKLFNAHYHSEHLWTLFLESVESCRQDHVSFISYVANIKKQTCAYLNTFASIVKEFYDKEAKSLTVSKKDIYSQQNADKLFVSFDVKEANYQTMAHIIRKRDLSFPETWVECVGKFTSSRFLKECKYFRQTVMGKTTCVRYHSSLCRLLFVQPLLDSIMKKFPSPPISVSADEVIFQVEKFPGLENLLPLVADQKDQRWHVSQFQLCLLSKKHSYFVKVLEEPTKQRQLKCVKEMHACQAVKRDLDQEIQENDLYFVTQTGETAKFLNPTLF